MTKIKVSDVHKKHLRILGYLVGSTILAYVAGLIAKKPELVYFSPVINYVIYFVQLELKKEGYVRAIRK